jgi:secreted trypsin-like serine protease
MTMLRFAVLLVSCSVALGAVPIWSPSGCGTSKYADAGETQPLPGRIVGGIQAREYEYPWQASIRRKSTNSHFCGGSIINENWILTAAHCMDGETPNQVSVVVGEHSRSSSSVVRQTKDVASIFSHTGYNSNTMQNDISLIKVSTPIYFNQDVQAVCAPDSANLYEYRKCQCSGWGTLSSGGSCCPDILQAVVMNVTTNTFCSTAYGSKYPIYSDMICASDNIGGTERDSCQGDSGGPLTVKESDGTFRLVGIVSWGIGCASGYPGVYARTSVFNDWVTNIITNN